MELESLYEEYWNIHSKYLESCSPLELAAILLTHAMTIYKTVLDDDDYNKMVDGISSMRNQVKTLPNLDSYLH